MTAVTPREVAATLAMALAEGWYHTDTIDQETYDDAHYTFCQVMGDDFAEACAQDAVAHRMSGSDFYDMALEGTAAVTAYITRIREEYGHAG